MDDTIRSLEALRNILRQTYGYEGWEVKTVQGCIESVQGRHLKLQSEYTEFKDTLFNHPDQYYEGLAKPIRALTEPCSDPNCSVCGPFNPTKAVPVPVTLSPRPPMGHVWFVCDPECERPSCPYCSGGLGACIVCGAAEGQLTTDCPGYSLYPKQREDTFHGKHDFINGRWVDRAE